MAGLLVALKYVHILSAVVAVGANLTYLPWLAAAEREPAHLAYTIRRVRWLDRFVANPGYAVLLLTGLALAYLEGLPLTEGWLLAAILLYVLVALLGIALYAPTIRRQVAALERGGPADAEYRRQRDRANALGATVIAIVLVILALMVTKPS